ncbi:MAG: WYL domain-containing protein [Candidatus Pacebacteria bacterium]|nr:WYL domain-containing protein [Candidatus Paceibacterota bacterium]
MWNKQKVEYLALKLLEEVGYTAGCDKEISEILDDKLKNLSSNLTDKEKSVVENKLFEFIEDYKSEMCFETEEDNHYDHEPIYFDEKIRDLWCSAVRNKQIVEIIYNSTTSGETKRLVDPYKTRSPFCEGFCHLRNEVRKFRFDRFVDIKITDKNFIKPDNY